MIVKINHIEIYSANAKILSNYFNLAFGFKIIGYLGPETGIKDKVSYQLIQNEITLLITGTPQAENEIFDFVKLHGDGVKTIGLFVDDLQNSIAHAITNGAQLDKEIQQFDSENYKYSTASIKLMGDVNHQLIDYEFKKGELMPNYTHYSNNGKGEDIGLISVDHCTANVESGKLNYWINFYDNVFNFQETLSFDDKEIYSDKSALVTRVTSNLNSVVQFPIIQPVDGEWKSQIQEFLDYNKGPGIQHIALTSSDIIKTAKLLKDSKVGILEIPDNYYSDLEHELPELSDLASELKKYNIMVDKENDGYLFQFFTTPLSDRPTFFIEIIQREGAKSFGKRNVKTFFQALVDQQYKRGNI